MATYTLEAGRSILRDGVPIGSILRAGPTTNPVEVDALARMTVAALNLCQRLEEGWPEVFDEDAGINGCDAVDSLVEHVTEAARINAGC